MKRITIIIIIICFLSGCSNSSHESSTITTSPSISNSNTAKEITLIRGYMALSGAENMINRIFKNIDYLQFYRNSLEYQDKEGIEKYSSLSSDIYGCGLHLWYDTSSKESVANNIKGMCDVINENFDEFYEYLTDIESRISQLINMHEMLYYYEQTHNKFFFEEFDKNMENIQSWLSEVNNYDWNMSLLDLKLKLSDYLDKEYVK